MQSKKMKLLRLFTVGITLAYLLVLPQVSYAKTIAEKADDAVDNLQDLQDQMNDLEDEISQTYGATVLAGDKDIATAVSATTSYFTSGADTSWSSEEYLYTKGSGNTGTTVQVGDTRVLPYSTFMGNTTVATGDGDLTGVTAITTATNLKLGGGEVYIAAGATVAANDTRATNAKIYTSEKLSTHFTEITDMIQDARDELDKLKGEIVPAKNLTKLDNEVGNFNDAAESAIDEIEANIHTNLNDLFDKKKTNAENKLDNLDDDMADVKAGIDSNNKDVEDFVDNISDIETNVTDILDSVGTNLTNAQMLSFISDLNDELNNAEDEINDLSGGEFTDGDKTKATNAWDDLETAFGDALDEIENNVTGTVKSNFSDERDSMEEDIDLDKTDLDNILSGENGSSTISKKVKNAIDKLNTYKDDVYNLNSIFLGSYGATTIAGDDDLGTAVTGTTLYKTSGNYVYQKGTGNTGTTVQVGDLRVTNYSTTYRAGTATATGNSDLNSALTAASYDITGGDTTFAAGEVAYSAAGASVAAGDTRITRAEIIYLSELQDLFSDLENSTDDFDSKLRDLLEEELTDSEKTKIASAYDRFKNKVDDYVSDIEDKVHSTLSDDFDNYSEDNDNNIEDLDSLIESIKEGTDITVTEKVNKFSNDMADIRDDINTIRDSVTTISSTTSLRSYFSDLNNSLDDVDKKITKLEDDSYTDTEKKRINDAFSNIEDAFSSAIDEIESNLSGTTYDNEFDTRKTDLEDDIDATGNDLASILKGGATVSKEINDLVDDIKKYRDDMSDVYDTLAGITAGSINSRTDVRSYSGDIQDVLDDAVDALTNYEDEPTRLGVSRIKSVVSSLEDKKDDATNELEDKLSNDDTVNNTWDDESDDIDSKWDSVDEAAQAIYDRAPEDEEPNPDDEEEPGDGEATDEDGDGNIDFSDVSSKNVFKEYIDALVSQGIAKGYSDGKFKPDNQVTRGEFLKMVVGASESDTEEVEEGEANFDDVKKTNDFYKYINYAAGKGYLKGYSDGTFKPNAPITRFEAVAILLRFKGVEVSNVPAGSQYFLDVTSPSMAGYTDAAFDQEILSGYKDNTFRPQNNITRGESAKVIVKAFS